MSPLLLEGLTDAAGFVLGGLVGFGLTRLLGFDLFAPGYSNGSLVAIVAVGLLPLIFLSRQINQRR